MKYSLKVVDKVLETERKKLADYCQYLANRYNETLEGKYRIKYNDLYFLLYFSLSDDKKVLFFNSFAESLDIYPIEDIKSLKLKEF
jgi:hypothetical protein